MATGGKKPRGSCHGHLHPRVSSLAVPSPSYCCMWNEQMPGLDTTRTCDIHGLHWKHHLKFSVSVLSSCRQAVHVTMSSLTLFVQHLSVTTCGMTGEKPVLDTWAHGKHPCHPLALRVPGNTLWPQLHARHRESSETVPGPSTPRSDISPAAEPCQMQRTPGSSWFSEVHLWAGLPPTL